MALIVVACGSVSLLLSTSQTSLDSEINRGVHLFAAMRHRCCRWLLLAESGSGSSIGFGFAFEIVAGVKACLSARRPARRRDDTYVPCSMAIGDRFRRDVSSVRSGSGSSSGFGLLGWVRLRLRWSLAARCGSPQVELHKKCRGSGPL